MMSRYGCPITGCVNFVRICLFCRNAKWRNLTFGAQTLGWSQISPDDLLVLRERTCRTLPGTDDVLSILVCAGQVMRHPFAVFVDLTYSDADSTSYCFGHPSLPGFMWEGSRILVVTSPQSNFWDCCSWPRLGPGTFTTVQSRSVQKRVHRSQRYHGAVDMARLGAYP